jgi:hypothetical protein
MNTPSGAREPVRKSATTMATPPPFHKLPIRRVAFNHLALLSQERERAMLRGEIKGEAIGRIDMDIREVLRQTSLGSMLKGLLSGQERTRVKIDRLLREVGDLVEELAALEGTVEWFSEWGRSPYAPIYPLNLGDKDLVKLREKVMTCDD